MNNKYVKDGKHNRYPAYCCEDIDKDLGARVKGLEEAVAALVAGTIPDGSVTLAKMAAEAHTYMREINKGRLLSEWVGTQEEYDAHVAENGGEPLANVRYTITDKPASYAAKAGVLSLGEPVLNSEKRLTTGAGYYFIRVGNVYSFFVYWNGGATSHTVHSNSVVYGRPYFENLYLEIKPNGEIKVYLEHGETIGNTTDEEKTSSYEIYTAKIGE